MSIKKRIKKVKKHSKNAIRVWRVITATIIFIILVPTFIATHTNDHFYTIVFSLTGIVLGLGMIIKQPLRKKIQRYAESGMYLLGMGALVLFLAATLVEEPLAPLRTALFAISALFYAFGLQRLGIGYAFGVL